MHSNALIVALGERRYRVERPWGDLVKGSVTDVAVDPRGHVFVLLRWDPLADTTSPRVAPTRRRNTRASSSRSDQSAAFGEGRMASTGMARP